MLKTIGKVLLMTYVSICLLTVWIVFMFLMNLLQLALFVALLILGVPL